MSFKSSLISTENMFDLYEVQVKQIQKNKTIYKLMDKKKEMLKQKEIKKLKEDIERLTKEKERLTEQYKQIENELKNIEEQMKSISEQLRNKEKENKYIAFDIKTLSLEQNEEKIIRRCQYIGIQQPLICYKHDKKNTYLLFNDILEYKLSGDKLETFTQSDYNRILVQLILIFNEFEHRNFQWQISDLSQLYYIDGFLQTLIIEYVKNENKCEREQLFKKLINEYFSKYLNIDIFNQDDQFRNLLIYLLDQEEIKSGQFEVEAAFEQTIKWLLKVSDFKQVYQTPYCIVKQFDTPQLIKKIIHNLPERMIFKQKKVHQNNKFYDQLIINLEREIEISEKNLEYKQLSSCLFYIRILEKPFLFMKYYKYQLSDIFKFWAEKQNIEFYKLKVYHLCYSFLTAIFELELANMIHRDLKPQNIFLEDWDENNIEFLLNQSIIIADFDRSKQQDFSNLQKIEQKNITVQKQENIRQHDQNKIEITKMTGLNSENTGQYDPPEDEQTLQYDIWQFGLICLSIANKGVFVGNKYGGRGLEDEEYNQKFSFEAIKNTLSHTDYSVDFLDILAKCLRKDHNKRIINESTPGRPIGQLKEILDNLYQKELKMYQKVKRK